MKRKISDNEIENAASMSEVDRLEAFFKRTTNKAIANCQEQLEVARAMGDEEAKKVLHIQISLFRSAQSILHTAKLYATDVRWQNE